VQFIEKGKIMLKEILEFLYSKYKILSLAIMLVVLVFGICLFIQSLAIHMIIKLKTFLLIIILKKSMKMGCKQQIFFTL